MKQTTVGPEAVSLLGEGAMHWSAGDAVFVADLHLGKAETFRRAAIPLPEGGTDADLDRLSAVLQRTGAGRLVVLGDFLHDVPGRDEASWIAWRERHEAVDVLIVRGNHDARAGDPPAAWRVRCVDQPSVLGPFVLRHHPEADHRGHVLAGHVHPVVRLRGTGRDRLRLPCFHMGTKVTVLPAFTAFSGGHAITPRPDDRVAALVDGTVIDVSDLARAA